MTLWIEARPGSSKLSGRGPLSWPTPVSPFTDFLGDVTVRHARLT